MVFHYTRCAIIGVVISFCFIHYSGLEKLQCFHHSRNDVSVETSAIRG